LTNYSKVYQNGKKEGANMLSYIKQNISIKLTDAYQSALNTIIEEGCIDQEHIMAQRGVTEQLQRKKTFEEMRTLSHCPLDDFLKQNSLLGFFL